MKKFRALSEQHREKGRFKPTIPHNVKSHTVATPKLDEVSDEMLTRYKEKAKADADKLESEKKYGAALKRRTGVLNAVGKMVGRAGQKIGQLAREEVESLDEKNSPTNPELWARAKSMAKSKFDVYPSAYANGWAAKWYKSKGGGWKSVSESKEDLPFDPDPKPKKKQVVPGKHGEGYSTVRHLARMAMQKQIEKNKKPIKEEGEMSKKAQIVKDVVKKKKDEKSDKFQSEPIVSQSITKNY